MANAERQAGLKETSQKLGPKLLKAIKIEGRNVLLTVTPQTLTQRYTEAYVFCTFPDKTREEKRTDIALNEGALPETIMFGRPAETFSFRLVTKNKQKDGNLVTVHPAGIEGDSIILSPQGFAFSVPYSFDTH